METGQLLGANNPRNFKKASSQIGKSALRVKEAIANQAANVLLSETNAWKTSCRRRSLRHSGNSLVYATGICIEPEDMLLQRPKQQKTFRVKKRHIMY